MDAETQQLIDRARQRRELLNQKIGKTPEAAPRKQANKRRTPLAEDVSVNLVQESEQQDTDDSPKRQRMLEKELATKADTHDNGDQDASTPVPIPRKSLSSPPLQRREQQQQVENMRPDSTRKKRFADLASDIQQWEDDLSHHTIEKKEEKKPRWQPPKGTTNVISVAPISSPKKTPAPPPPTGARYNSQSEVTATPSSTLSTSSSTPSTSYSSSTPSYLSQSTPARSANKTSFNSTPKPFQPYSQTGPRRPAPVKSPVPVRANLAGGVGGGVQSNPPAPQDTPKTRPSPAAPKPWEKKACEGVSSGIASSTPVARPVMNSCTPARGGDTPGQVGAREEEVRMRPKVRKSVDDEPTAHPVSARMSAWEQISSAQVVSDIKKVKPSSATTPAKTPNMATIRQSPSMRAAARVTATTTTTTPCTTPATASKTWATPTKTPLTPSKSFKDSILERAAQVNPVTAAEATRVSPSSPNKKSGSTPQKASSAMRAVQQHLIEQTQSTSMAERIRQERMAELKGIQERWKNGILNEEEPYNETPNPDTKRQAVRDQARSDFGKKLESIGFGSQSSSQQNAAAQKDMSSGRAAVNPEPNNTPSSSSSNSANLSQTPKAPPVPPALPSSFSSSSTSSSSSALPPRPPQPAKSSLYQIVSQRKQDGGSEVKGPQPYTAPSPGKTGKKVKFEDSFDSDDTEHPTTSHTAQRNPGMDTRAEPSHQLVVTSTITSTTNTTHPQGDNSDDSDTTEDSRAEDPTEEDDDSDYEVELRRPQAGNAQQRFRPRPSEEDDDLSLSAFVPASVRHQSVLPSPQQQSSEQRDRRDASTDSSDRQPRTPHYPHNREQGRRHQHQRYQHRDSSSSSDSSEDQRYCQRRTQPQAQASGYNPDDTEDSVDDRNAIGDLLDEAMDSSESEDANHRRVHSPAVVMRKRPSHRKATEDGELPFSISEYRASRNMQVLEVKQTIVRNSRHVGTEVREERVEMPQQPPTPAPRQCVQERVRELQELIQQEQSVIMQTSNALNQCCSSASYFAGSTEQVECNRILLIACQKRQAYMMEIQRLRDTKVVDPSGPGPKGSLTISDIRLPLKKEFVTKIGTSHDTTTHYFIILVRNGPQIVSTQMLSTHDPMMRGSLDFPNLIKINGITGSFKLSLDIYSMCVTHEPLGKGKKKKTPKKSAKSAHTVPTMGGSVATRTTSFSQVTSVPLTMRSLDRHNFPLDRLSHLSPLHGTIYMNLKCLMEASVEERGFLTMFEDVSGLGSWHRRWCALSGNKLQYWKYPDDETRKDPMGYIDLKRCITEKVGLISRDVCARPHTFELTIVRQPLRGERDTLTSRTHNTMTSVKHMLSADTKEERIVWCNKVNQALANIRTWHADALRPVRQ